LFIGSLRTINLGSDNMSSILKPQNRTKLYAIFVIVAIVGGYVVLSQGGYLNANVTTDLGSDSQCSYAYEIVGIDENGDTVQIPVDTNPLQSGFSIGGIAAVKLGIGVEWTVTGTGVDWSTLVVSGTVEISIVTGVNTDGDNTGGDVVGLIYADVMILTFSDTNLTGVWQEILELGSDLADSSDSRIDGSVVSDDTDTYLGEGWYYKFDCKMTATVTDVIGDSLSESITVGVFGVWIQYDSELGLSGKILD